MSPRFLRITLGVALIIILAIAATNPFESQSVALHSASGKRFPTRKVVRFPLAIETSSLAYDDSTQTFYTTADKGKPHIVEFRLAGKKVEVIRADTILGLKKNYDFEGIEVVERPQQARYLQVATERWHRNDSLVVCAVSLDNFTYLPDLSFAVQPEGIGENNNFEGVTVVPATGSIVLGKERQPYGLYLKVQGEPAVPVFGEFEFQPVYERYLDSALSPVVAADRLAILKQVSISGLAFDDETGSVLVLNRYGRCVISLLLTEGTPVRWRIADIWPYEGIDDEMTDQIEPAMLVYGIAEGIAVWGVGEDRSVGLITDPGTGKRPTLYVFPYPQ